uniref:Vps41 beta-propeller domain-containing protein n=1 Tax=Lotus japonicus TaxID=34305 RepID=I3SKD3_LOTJA|nr:unknown [Lotus japonicus]
MKFEHHRPMKAIALDPEYARKMSRRFVAGGLAGHLYLNSKKWLGYRDQVRKIIVLLVRVVNGG